MHVPAWISAPHRKHPWDHRAFVHRQAGKTGHTPVGRSGAAPNRPEGSTTAARAGLPGGDPTETTARASCRTPVT